MTHSPNRSRAATAAAVLAALTAALAFAPPAPAQEADRDTLEVVHVPPIVVTATRTETPTREIASDIEVVTREAIERRGYPSVLDLLRDLPGVHVAQTGAAGGTASVFLRGAPAEHTLVLIDGVEVNDPAAPAGAYDFAHLDIADVERIEVLKGPQSPLYGSTAMGGVVQILTRAPDAAPRAALRVEGGSFGSWSGTATASGGAGPTRYGVAASHRATGGISAAPERLGNEEADGDRRTTLSGSLEWRASDPVVVGLDVRGQRSETDLDQDGPQGDDPNYETDQEEAHARLRVTIRAGERWRHDLSAGVVRHDRETSDGPDAARPATRGSTDFEGRRWTARWTARGEAGPGLAIGGVEWESERAETAFEGAGPFGPYAGGLPEASARTVGAFAQHQARLGERLFVVASARVDHHDAFGAAATWRVAPTFLARSTGTRLTATVGTGFKAPTLSQLFDPVFGAPDLDPEESLGWDAGVEQDLAGGRVRVGATVFTTEFEDLVAFETDGYRNVASARTSGVEATLSARPVDRLGVTASYTYTEAVDEEADEPLVRRPRHAADVDVAARFPGGGDATLGARWVGERDDLDFSAFPAERVTLDPYLVVRAAASWPIGSGLRIYGRLENLLDETYQEVLNYATPGRSAYVGVKAEL